MPAVEAQVRRNLPMSEFTIDPANVATIVAANQNVTVPGVRIGDIILPIPPNALTTGVCPTPVMVATADTLAIRFINPTAGGVDAASGTWVLISLNGLPAQTFTIDPANVTTVTAANQNVTVPGLRIGDIILPIPPNALTANVQPGPVRVATADTLAIRFANPTVADIDPASGVWTLINLNNMVLGEFTMDPANVATIVSANQDITVPGLRIGDIILPIPANALTAGVLPYPVRVATADTLTIRFTNPTAGGINPPSQVWTLIRFR